ncbi:MAG: type II secretion system F family protein [Candidatus Hodarchaeales archaeon]
MSIATIRRISYLRFGKPFEKYIEQGKFEQLEKQLRRAGYDISLRQYLGLAAFTVFCAAIVGLVGGLIAVFLLNLGPMFYLVPIFGCIPFGLAFYLPYQAYPGIKARERKALLDSALPTAASYMGAMASAGVPPDVMFASLASEQLGETAIEINKEARRITRDTEALGLDILRALRKSAAQSPSSKWTGFCEGFVGTITAGGDLTFFLSSATKELMRYKEEETKEFIESLGVMAEIFMVLGVVAPLFFIIMIAILSVIGGGAGAQVLLFLLTYLLLPIAMGMMLLLIDVAEVAE